MFAQWRLFLPLTAGLLFSGSGALSQGFIIPERPTPRELPLTVKSVRVSTVIHDSLAETTVEQTFLNSAPVEQEGTYLFPLPEGASVTSFSLRAGERVIEGKIMGKEEARRIYESIVRRRQDPALLEYVGRGMFRSSVFPIPARGERQLTLKYTEMLKPQGGARRFVYPLSTGRFSARPIQVASVVVRLKTSAPLKAVYSPSHDVSVRRLDDHNASASWETRGEFPDRDFLLYYATSPDDIGITMLLQTPPGQDGYFLLIASPRFSVPKEQILPKQVVFVLDRTGSMQPNGKMEQAKNALHFCLDALNPGDRFNVITFNESTDALAQGMTSASKENVARAHRFVNQVEPSGGTNINEALEAALKILKEAEGAQKMVVFLTDGLPTVGETNVDRILQNVRRLNGEEKLVSSRLPSGSAALRARIFPFGVGYDVNVPFLDRLAAENRGDADYVRPNESVEAIVSAFFARVSSPVLTGLKLTFEDAQVYDLYPRALPDLFKGSELVVAGRFRGSPRGSVKLTGYAQDRLESFRLGNAFDPDVPRNSLVSRIWASRKIGYLLDQVRLQSSQEVIDEIVRLSRDYGIITPYTSYLADERQDGIARPEPLGANAAAYRFETEALRLGEENAKRDLLRLSQNREASGEDETHRSLNAKGYQSAGRAPAAAQTAPGGARGGLGGFGVAGGGRLRRKDIALDFSSALAGKPADAADRPGYKLIQESARVQSVAGKTFFRRGSLWFDNAYKEGRKVVKVKALSDAHFQLLDAIPGLNRYAAVGDEVIIDLGKAAVQIGREGKERLTDRELKELAGT